MTPPRHSRYYRIRTRLEAFEPGAPATSWLFEFLLFGFKQGWACLFGALLLALLLGTHLFYPVDASLARYDFLVLAAVAIQGAMLALRLETLGEARVILAFHIVGTVMELFKTHVGSWSYPEPSLLRIDGVPLFTGFMYAAVGSYIARIWRIFSIEEIAPPPRWQPALLAAVIYINFFTHHSLPDARWLLFAATGLIWRQTWFTYTPLRTRRRMPILLGFLLVALFIWVAENIATYANAWTYPHQRGGWALVPFTKLGAWYLLMIISFVLVSLTHPRDVNAASIPHR